MRSLFIGLSATIHQAVRRLAMLSLLLMFLTMLVQIFARYGFDAPPTWTEEVARYLMVWTGLLGATMSFHQRADAVLMDSVMPARLRGLAHGLQSAAVLVFLLPVLYFSFFSWRGVWRMACNRWRCWCFCCRSCTFRSSVGAAFGVKVTWAVPRA